MVRLIVSRKLFSIRKPNAVSIPKVVRLIAFERLPDGVAKYVSIPKVVRLIAAACRCLQTHCCLVSIPKVVRLIDPILNETERILICFNSKSGSIDRQSKEQTRVSKKRFNSKSGSIDRCNEFTLDRLSCLCFNSKSGSIDRRMNGGFFIKLNVSFNSKSGSIDRLIQVLGL